MEHVEVYRRERRYAGWPANYGMWSWGNEIVVGFTLCYHTMADGELVDGGGLHPRDPTRAPVTMQARSTDGGRSWRVRGTPAPTPGGRSLSADEHIDPALFEELHVGALIDGPQGPVEHPGGINFDHPDFGLLVGRTGIAQRFPGRSWFYVTNDRGTHWNGPYQLPRCGYDHVTARTDYIVMNDRECLLFLSAMDGPPLQEQPGPSPSDIVESDVICVRAAEWGGEFEYVGRVTEGAIMPASVRLADGTLLSSVRREHRIDLFGSEDGGKTWDYRSTPADTMGGNPPTLTRLQDDRLCITYGYRGDANPGIRATISNDDGHSWSDPIILRDDAGTPDLGYPRTTERPDGQLVTVYYFNDAPASERYIAATIWDPWEETR